MLAHGCPYPLFCFLRSPISVFLSRRPLFRVLLSSCRIAPASLRFALFLSSPRSSPAPHQSLVTKRLTEIISFPFSPVGHAYLPSRTFVSVFCPFLFPSLFFSVRHYVVKQRRVSWLPALRIFRESGNFAHLPFTRKFSLLFLCTFACIVYSLIRKPPFFLVSIVFTLHSALLPSLRLMVVLGVSVLMLVICRKIYTVSQNKHK